MKTWSWMRKKAREVSEEAALPAARRRISGSVADYVGLGYQADAVITAM